VSSTCVADDTSVTSCRAQGGVHFDDLSCQDRPCAPPDANIDTSSFAWPNPVDVGSTAGFQFRVANLGPAPAQGVVATISFPPALPPNAGTLSVAGTGGSVPCSLSGGQIVCNIGTLAVYDPQASTPAVATIEGSAATTMPGQYVATMTVTTASNDTNWNNNTAEAEWTVQCPSATPRWNAATSKCEVCAPGMTWDTQTRECECDPGSVECNGQCVNNICGAGESFDADPAVCSCHEDCTGGRVWNGTECACPGGAPWSRISLACDPTIVASGEIVTWLSSSGYSVAIYTAPGTSGALVTAKGMYTSDWYQAGSSLTQSDPYLVEVPFNGGSNCDHVWKHPENNMVGLGMNNTSQSATTTGSISVGPGGTVAIAGSDCYFPDNFQASELVIWEARLQ
jgi:hypothetical protein